MAAHASRRTDTQFATSGIEMEKSSLARKLNDADALATLSMSTLS